MTFRSKLLLAILAIVAATTISTLFIAQSANTASYQRLVDELFQSEIESFIEGQEQQLAATGKLARSLASSVRLFAVMEDFDPDDPDPLPYQVAGDELRMESLEFFRLIAKDGRIIPPPADSRAKLIGSSIDYSIGSQLQKTAAAGAGQGGEQFGFVQHDSGAVLAVLSLPISNPAGGTAGSLVIGQTIGYSALAKKDVLVARRQQSLLLSGLLVFDEIYSRRMPEAMWPEVRQRMSEQIKASPEAPANWVIEVGGARFRAGCRLINPRSSFAPAYLVSLYPLAELERQQQSLLWRITLTGVCGLLAAAGIGSVMAKRLSQPVRDLVAGTKKVREGDFAARVRKRSDDELGELADSFNEMTEGLALKEKYRSVLQLVTDKQVADELIHGTVQLGGETREVAVIFCDIRGFTSISQGMEPKAVIEMLNGHMSALTRIVHEHRGVVDKFVGDSIMSLFGAPKSYGGDAEAAVRCAWAMARERERLNAEAAIPLRIGIGIACGPVLAGCMGSDNRLDYTVVGERVNLAARLCSVAGPMEVVVDETVRSQLPAGFKTEPLEPLSLKGFSGTVTAHRVIAAPGDP